MLPLLLLLSRTAATACALTAAGQTLAAERVPFETIVQGDQSAIDARRQVVVRTAAEWKTLWREHAPDTPAPAVDFTTSMIVAVFAGYRNTAGFTVTVTEIEKQGSTLTVKWQEGKPARDVMLAQVLTFPFHIVKTARHEGEVVFRRADSK
jgi:hypothetical protein